MDIVARRFNDAFAYRWQRVIDFLKLHYVLSQRSGSAYWREHRAAASVPESLRELLRLWRFRAPSHRDFPRGEEIFPSASWQYILYGMGFKPQNGIGRSDAGAAARGFFAETERATRRLLDALPGNRALIEHIRARGLALV